jgi:hypothetical protein
MNTRSIVTPPSPRYRRARVASEGTATKGVPTFLTIPRRVQWNPIEKKVERDALKNDHLLTLLRSNFTWGSSSNMTSNDWLTRPEVVPDIITKISESKMQAERQRAMRENEEGVRRLRESLGKISSHKHSRPWDGSEKISPEVSRQMWRTPDPTPNQAPDLNFRSNTPLPRGQRPWKPSEDYPNASSQYLKVSGLPVQTKAASSGQTTFSYRFQTTESYQQMVRPLVAKICEKIKTEIDAIDDDCAASSVKNAKCAIKKDLAGIYIYPKS